MGLAVIVALAAASFATGTTQARQVQPPGAHEVTPHGAPDMSGTWMLIDAADRPAAAAHELTVTQDSTSFAVAASGGTIPRLPHLCNRTALRPRRRERPTH